MNAARAWFPRIVLFLVGALLAFVGVRLGIDPAQADLTASTPAGVTSIRVAFGGFHGGLGLFAIICALSASTVRMGLLGVGATALCVVVFRAYGLYADGADAANFTLLGRECSSAFLIAIAVAVYRPAIARAERGVTS